MFMEHKTIQVKPELAKMLTQEELLLAYKNSDIHREYVDIMREFTNNLMYNLHSTFLGDVLTRDEADIKNHFLWCFNKTVNNYKFINFNLKEKYDYFNYMYNHALGQIYNNKDYDDIVYVLDVLYFSDLLNYNKPKTSNDFLIMSELYFKTIDFIS
jgi:hypothetical protein